MVDMHVTLVGSHPLPDEPSQGGVQRVVQVLRRGLAERLRVSLVVPDSSRSLRHVDASGEIIYLKIPACPRILTYWSWCSRATYRAVERFSPDIVHVQDLAGFSLLWPRYHGKRSRPWIFTPHGVNDREVAFKADTDMARRMTASLRSSFLRSVERISRGRFDISIVINSYLFDAMPDLTKMHNRLIPNPVDEVFLTSSDDSCNRTEGYNLLYVGEVSARKNVLALVRMMSEIVRRGVDAHLHIVGPFAEDQYLKTCLGAVEDMNLNSFITFHGNACPQDLVWWMDKSDVLVLASKQETAPMVVAEAHCRGLAVAVPHAFGLVSMVSEGKDGVFLSGQDLSEDASRVLNLLTSGLDREAIRRDAARKYKLEHVIDSTIDVYQQALRTRQT
ncbi:glycosyltransferase family 4 protein [Microvirga splendida]|uniref:Glycosyltransferase family 4 protein n=1 Tax=Microvirga splendida TaxID=2795727 RepID=A0ABS0Y1M4_9HYPH|nr:glycosyltransferase family 4 protein [Microvirga splendida]MBJ6126169.1 glycosyltransferase family 4 protein [Microvirga splendida]